MENREYDGEEQGEYPSGPSYSGQDEWNGGNGNPYAVSWQNRPYGQAAAYEHPRSQTQTQPEVYTSSYDRSSTNLGYTDFATDATDNRPSFYQYGQHTQPTYMYPHHDPAVNTSQVPGYYQHTQVPLDAYGVGHHHHAAPVPPCAYVDHSAPPPQQQTAQQSTCVNMSTTSESSSQTDYAGSFLACVQKFVARHREAFDLLVEGQRGSEDEIHHNAHSSEMYEFGEPDAIEYHMSVEPYLRRSRFLELVSVGDVVRGHVTDKNPRELSVQVTSFVGTHKHREVSDIGIKGIVPFDNLADSAEKCGDVLGEMQMDDVVQGIVAYQKDNGCLVLSFRGDHIEQLCADGQLPSGVRVGYMEGRRPLSPRSRTPKPDDYLSLLEEEPGFLNPSSSDNLKLVLGIRNSSGTAPLPPGTRPTLIKDFQKEAFPESDYCHALRKAQRSKWSMDTVAIGVKHFKAGENSKAMKYFDHALEIDDSNVEGLVARGALFANDGKYKEGIADFEKALTLKHTHRNARNYLVQTQVAYGERLEKDGKLERAVQCYREALADDPGQLTARTRLELISAALEKQAAEKKELERKKLEEKATLKKLQNLIEKEREKRSKKPKARKTKRKQAKESKVSKRKKKVSSRSKVKKEHRRRRRRETSSEEESSDESTDTLTSDYSRSRSRSPKLIKHTTKRQRSPCSRSTSPRSVSRSPRSKTKQTRSRSRTPRVRSKQSSGLKSGSKRTVSTSFSDSSTSPARKHQSKHKYSEIGN